ncbi:MAG: biotin--[acetyl-CoA-carboxylase] ligase [Alphaproteobacteria bacterium]
MADPVLPLGFVLHRFDAVGSTMDVARDMIGSKSGIGARGAVVWAAEQTGGRGRHGRQWSSPPGNLYATVILYHDRPTTDAPQLAMVAGVALAEAVADDLPAGAVSLKWPNDLLLNDAKTAGILLEGNGKTASPVLIGSGVNIASAPDNTPYQATTLREAGSAIDPASLLERYIAALAQWTDRWNRQGFDPVRARWLSVSAGLGKPVTIRLPDGEKRGIFADMDETGTLILKTEDGNTEKISAGDVFFR